MLYNTAIYHVTLTHIGIPCFISIVYNRSTDLHLSFRQPQQAIASALLYKNYDK